MSAAMSTEGLDLDNRSNRHPDESRELFGEVPFDQSGDIGVDDGEDLGSPSGCRLFCETLILVGYPVNGINHQEGKVSLLHNLLSAAHSKELSIVIDFWSAPYPGGIDEMIRLAIKFDHNIDRITSGSRYR